MSGRTEAQRWGRAPAATTSSTSARMMRRSGSPVRRPRPPDRAGFFLEDQKGGGLREGLLLAPEFRLEMTDAVPVAALEPLEPGLAGGHGVVSLLAGKTPALDLFGVEPVAAAVFGKSMRTEACAVKDGSELLAGGPALGSVVMVGKQSPFLPPSGAGSAPPRSLPTSCRRKPSPCATRRTR
jgi:hypothetical protein